METEKYRTMQEIKRQLEYAWRMYKITPSDEENEFIKDYWLCEADKLAKLHIKFESLNT